MAEPGQGEVSPQGQPSRGETPRVSPEEELARRTWGNLAQQGELTPEQVKARIKRGVSPLISGGEPQSQSETIAKEGISDPQLLDYINRINTLINSGEPPREVLRMGLEAIMKLEGISEQEKGKILARIDSAFVEAPEQRREGLYGERKLTPSEKKEIENAQEPKDIEKLFNRMFDRVDSRPQVDFQKAFDSAGTFEFNEFMKTLNEEITRNNNIGNTERAAILRRIQQQFTNEREAREIIHNAYFGVLSGADTEGMAKYIDTFLSGWADLAFSKEGVTQAMHFYEQALLIVREKAGGYLKPKEVVGIMKKNEEGEVNILVKKYLNEANEKKMLGKDASGNPMKLEPWQIDRALSFARGMSIITGRTIEIAASSILPPGPTAFTDQYAQRIIAELAPFRHSYKFFVGSKFSRILAYVMDRGRKPWDPKEIQEFDNLKRLKNIEQFDVLNGLVPDGQERFYSVLNPFEIGGILSRTGWRITGAGVTIIDDLVREAGKIKDKDGKEVWNEGEAWIGTGVQIERKRGHFVKKEKSDDSIQAAEDTTKAEEARKHISAQLEKIGQRTPLRLFLNIRSVQDKVLEQIAKENSTTLKELREIMAKPREEWKTDEEKRIGGVVDKLQTKMDELVLLQEKANQNKQPLDNFIGEASEDTQEFVRKIRDIWKNGEKEEFLKTLQKKEWKLPYTFGTDDVPYNEYDFEVTGQRSVARRWGDMASAAKASKAFSELLTGMEHFKEQGQILEAMRKVYEGVKGYNEDDARKFTLKLAEGIIKFYGKGWQHRLPFGIGSVIGMATGKSSYAQIAYGRGAMAWDEIQVNEFTRLLRDNGMLTIEQQHELQKRAGGGKKEIAYGLVRTIVPLIGLAIIWYILSKAKDEK